MADSGRYQGPGKRNAVATSSDDRLAVRSGTGIERLPATALVQRTHDQRGEIRFVPVTPRPPFDPRLVFTDRDTARASAFRLLRQRLIDRRDTRTILCTSASHGEGKTTLAANLALAFAEPGRFRVLLLEATGRNGTLGELFGFDPPEGLRSQIARHRHNPSEPWVIAQIGPPPLSVLAMERNSCPRCTTVLPELARFCGACGTALAPHAASILDGLGIVSTIERFRETFDYIIIDTPPILTGGDVNLIQDVADAVVLATRKGQTDARNLRRAVEQIAPAPIAAIALLEP